MNIPSAILPQGLCTRCSFCLEDCLQISAGPLPHSIHSHLEPNVTSERPSLTTPLSAEAHPSPPFTVSYPSFSALQHSPSPTHIYFLACHSFTACHVYTRKEMACSTASTPKPRSFWHRGVKVGSRVLMTSLFVLENNPTRCAVSIPTLGKKETRA